MPRIKQQPVPVKYFVCSREDAQAEVRRQRHCEWWLYDWPGTDYYWLFGNSYPWMQPKPEHSPLARRYYDERSAEHNNAISQSVSSCESRRYPEQDAGTPGVRLRVASRLKGSGAHVSDGGDGQTGLSTPLSVGFAQGNTTPPPPCQSVPRELFENPVGFNYVLYGPGNGNFRWELRDAQELTPDPWFALYGRTLKFSGSNGAQFIGGLHLVIDQLADLWVRFEPRPIPAAVADRVDPEQALQFQISTGSGYFNIAVVVELLHVESGQIHSASIHGSSYSPGQLPGYGWWPSGWEAMAMDAEGVIHHHNVDWFYWISTIDPASVGLPITGTYRLRYILLAYGYRTENRSVSSSTLGGSGDTRMSWKPIFLSQMPSLITYTPGLTEGLIPPFEITYTRSPVLVNGIAFDAVFDMKNLTTFRFVVKVSNNHDFALGLIVQASGWQAWLVLQPGETRYLAGAVSVSGMASWNAYPLHPQSPVYGWSRGWSSTYIRMSPDGLCTIPFRLFLTAPASPDTVPNLAALQAVQYWYWDVGQMLPEHAPRWGAIKRYASDGQYAHSAELPGGGPWVGTLLSIERSITMPGYQALIDAGSYFRDGYDTSLYDWGSPWHKRPWPTYSGWGSLSGPIMCRGEKRRWDSGQNQYVWEAFEELSVSLSRAMLQQVAAALGVAEAVLMDGDDIRWFQLGPGGSWNNVLWIDRFYAPSGALVDEPAMRGAFQNVLDNNTAAWPDYRNLVVHAAVRFGSFLDNGGFEVGEYLLGPDGVMTEVGSLADLGAISTRFRYHIKPTFR